MHRPAKTSRCRVAPLPRTKTRSIRSVTRSSSPQRRSAGDADDELGDDVGGPPWTRRQRIEQPAAIPHLAACQLASLSIAVGTGGGGFPAAHSSAAVSTSPRHSAATDDPEPLRHLVVARRVHPPGLDRNRGGRTGDHPRPGLSRRTPLCCAKSAVRLQRRHRMVRRGVELELLVLQLIGQRTSTNVLVASVAARSRDSKDPRGHGCHPLAVSIHQEELLPRPRRFACRHFGSAVA